MASPFTPTPIYQGGQLVGISDPIRQQTRIDLTARDRLLYSKPTPVPTPEFKHSSDLLKQSFRTEGDLKRAEQEFKAKRGIRDIDVDLPKIEKQKEVYDSRSRTFIKPDTRGTVQTVRQLTPEERRRIEEADYKGSGEFLWGKAVEGVTTVMETKPVKKVTTTILEAESPTIRYFTGKDVTFGEALLSGTEYLGGIGKEAQLGSERTAQKIFEFAETKEGRTKEWLQVGGYTAKGVGTIWSAVPKVAQYIGLGVIGGASADLLATEQKIAEPEKYVEKEFKVFEEQYKKDYEKARQELPEGYELEPALTSEQLREQYIPEIESQVISGFRGEQVVPFALLTGAVAFKGAKAVKSGFEKKIMPETLLGGEQKRLIFTEQQVPVGTDKGIDVYSKFKLMDVRTPVTAYKQSFFGRVLGREPELVVLQRGQTYVTQPFANVFGYPTKVGDQYFALTGRVGKGGDLVNLRVTKVAGTGQQIDPIQISSLTKTERYLWRPLAEKTRTGVPVSEKDIPKMFRDEIFTRGDMITVDISKIGTGKQTSIFQTGTITTPIKEFESGAGIFRVETGFKDVTKPFARASGTIDTTRGIIIRTPVITTDTGTGVDIFMGGGKKSSADFLQQLYSQKTESIIKPIVKIPKPSVKIPSPTPSPIVTETPFAVGGAGLTTVPYAFGTPEFERTLIRGEEIETGRLGGGFSITGRKIQDLGTDVRIFTDVKPDTKIETKTDLISGTALNTAQQEKTKLFDKTIMSPRAVIKPIEKTMEAQKTSSALDISLKQTPSQKLITKLTPTPRTTPRPRPRPPETPTGIKPIKFSFDTKEEKKKIGEEDLFEVFVKKKGQDISVGEFKTKFEAREKLFKTIRTEIRASGFIEKEGKKIRTDTFGTEFTPSKVDKFRIVEPKRRRIKRGTLEAPQLKRARKKGGFFK
jgi:hypothetical protein